MIILCGLGNPGKKYDGTRHNAGFAFIDEYAIRNDFPEFIEKDSVLMSEKGFGDDKVILIKPQTFMNASGVSLSKFVNFYKLPLENLVVIYDDVDLELGKVRFRAEGSAGTHNGMKSVVEQLGSNKFPRLRLGVESRGVYVAAEMDISAFVLASFSEEEIVLFKEEIDEAVDLLEKSLA